MQIFGSLINLLLSEEAKSDLPVVGDPATVLLWTDRLPATVIEVTKYRKRDMVIVQIDHATRTDKNGMSEDQSWEYSRNPNDSIFRFVKNKEGYWKEYNKGIVKYGPSLCLGRREKYYDFTF